MTTSSPRKSGKLLWILGAGIIFLVGTALLSWGASILFPQVNIAAWAQAIGAIFAILSGFGVAAYQTKIADKAAADERARLARAAHLLAFEVIATVSDRLEAALTPKGQSKKYALRGDRTTEMVLAMREFGTAGLPGDMLLYFVRIRSHIYAVNKRISEIYGSEDRMKPEKRLRQKALRRERLESCVSIRTEALMLFDGLQLIAVSRFQAETKNLQTGPNLAGYSTFSPEVELSDP